jgi:hypothetical protein
VLLLLLLLLLLQEWPAVSHAPWLDGCTAAW